MIRAKKYRLGCRMRGTVIAVAFGGAVLSATSASAAVLLLNPGGTAATTTSLTGSAPYAVPTNATWNTGGSTYPATLLYADGSSAAGISVVADGELLATSPTTLDFAAPTVGTTAGGSPTGVFAANPAKDIMFFGSTSGDDSVAGLRITGLPNGTYDIYVAAAYTGSASAGHPANSDPSRQAVWIFSGPNTNTLTYDAGTNLLGGQARLDVMENSVNTWSQGNTFALANVTIDGSNPTLFIAASGAEAATGVAANSDDRAFINLVQIVPEPSSLVAAGILGGGLMLRRRRC